MQPGLQLNNLKYFYDAVETMSISEAARRNFITQSAVSQGIQKLEKALSVSLITHQRNHFKLTPEGNIVFSLTQQLFATLKAMQDIVSEQQSIVSGQINIACTQSVAVNLISSVLQKLKQDYPQVSMKMKVAKMESICQMLKRGLMDLGIVVESDLCEPFDKQVLREGFFQLYAKKASAKSLHEGVYVDHSNGLYVDKLLELYRKRFRKKLTILQELDSWQVLAKCAENGIGCCYLPDFLVAVNSQLKAVTLVAGIPYKVVAIYPKGVHLTRAAKAFLSLFTK